MYEIEPCSRATLHSCWNSLLNNTICPIIRFAESGRTNRARLWASIRLSAIGFSRRTVLPLASRVFATATCDEVLQATTHASASVASIACDKLVHPRTPGSSGATASRLSCRRATTATSSASAIPASVNACNRPKRPSPMTPIRTGAKFSPAIVTVFLLRRKFELRNANSFVFCDSAVHGQTTFLCTGFRYFLADFDLL